MGTGAAKQKSKNTLAVAFGKLSGEPLEGKQMALGKHGSVQLAKSAIVVRFQRPLATASAWVVGTLLGASTMFYLLFRFVLAGLGDMQAAAEMAHVLAPPAGIITWALLARFGPSRPDELRLGESDVVAALFDHDAQRALLQLSGRRLLGLQLAGSCERLQRYADKRWPRSVHEGPVKSHLVSRGFVIAITIVALLIATVLLLPLLS